MSFLRCIDVFTPPDERDLFRIHLITVIVSNACLKVRNAEEKVESQKLAPLNSSPEPSVCIYKEHSNLEAVIPFCCCLPSSSESSGLLVTFPFICTEHFLTPSSQCSSLSQHFPLYQMEFFFTVLFCF